MRSVYGLKATNDNNRIYQTLFKKKMFEFSLRKSLVGKSNSIMVLVLDLWEKFLKL